VQNGRDIGREIGDNSKQNVQNTGFKKKVPS
jgi:hypothetical protein